MKVTDFNKTLNRLNLSDYMDNLLNIVKIPQKITRTDKQAPKIHKSSTLFHILASNLLKKELRKWFHNRIKNKNKNKFYKKSTKLYIEKSQNIAKGNERTI
jgi:hypothetical protein